jgi:hypothetical protein
MAVLIEALSVVIKADRAIQACGGWEPFKRIVPNQTLCADGELVRIGFMAPDDVREFVLELEGFGLRYIEANEARDLCVVDQQRGALTKAHWLEVGRIALGGDPKRSVGAARMAGSAVTQIVTPEGWIWEGSLSSSFGFVPSEHFEATMTKIGESDGVEMFRSPLSDRPMYQGRVRRKSPPR